MRIELDINDEFLEDLRQEAIRRGQSDTAIVEQCLRAGLRALQRAEFPFRQQTYSMGVPLIDIDKVNSFVASLDDEECLRKLRGSGPEE